MTNFRIIDKKDSEEFIFVIGYTERECQKCTKKGVYYAVNDNHPFMLCIGCFEDKFGIKPFKNIDKNDAIKNK